MDVNAIIYSYKNPNLLDVVQNLLDSTDKIVHISILDQHPMDRSSKFKDLKNVDYTHYFWDKPNGPTWFKEETIFSKLFDAKYTLVLSDDTLVTEGWLEECISFINNNLKILVSGKGKRKAKNKDFYFLEYFSDPSEMFYLSHIIDRNFIFGLTESFYLTGYPRDIKYFGEEEIFSIRCLKAGISVYSAPNNLYKDLKLRTIENLYCPFSKEHNYNNAIELIETEDGKDWLAKIGISEAPLKLFYQIDDVPYDPYQLKIADLGGERFIANTKAIY